MMDEAFPKADRDTFQLLIDHPLDEIDTLMAESGASSESALRRRIESFRKKYQCHKNVQIINWERIGLHSFFVLTPDPIDHPYAVRHYEILGDQLYYFTQLVTPDLTQTLLKYPDSYSISKIHAPSNNIRLLYNDERTLSYTDEWLLNLKEVMVDQELGDILYQQVDTSKDAIPVDAGFLDQFAETYLSDLFDIRFQKRHFIKNTDGFLITYLDAQLPGMNDYLVILSQTDRPWLFAGGFQGRFTLAELFEAPNALICRFEIPDPNHARLSFNLFSYLGEVCRPSSFMVLSDTRTFRLHEQWDGDRWVKFEL